MGRPSARFSVGVIGTGFSASAHIDALRRVPGVRVAAIAGSDATSAAEAAERFDIERAHSHWTGLLADDSIDAVHNCTPNHLHSEIASAALAAGRHLLSEKPLAIDSVEGARLVAAATAAAGAGVASGVCFIYRHYPLVGELRARLRRGETGPAHLIRGTYLQDWLLESSDWNWRVDPLAGGPSRAVADIGSHWLDLAQHVTGDRVAAVLADVSIVHPVRRGCRAFTTDNDGFDEVAVSTEDAASVLLRFESGVKGALSVSQVSAGYRNRLNIEIDTGSASYAWHQEQPDELRIGWRDRANEVLVRDPVLLSPAAAALAHYPAGHPEGWPDALRNLFVDFYEAIDHRRKGKDRPSAVATFADAHQIIQIVEAIMRSSREERWVELAHTSPPIVAQEVTA